MLAVEPHSRQERAERVSLTTQPAPPPRPHSTMVVFRSRCGLPSESRLLASSHTNGLLACPLESLRDIHARMARPKFPWLNLHAGRAPQVIAVLRVAARKACESENSPLRCNKSPGRNVYLCESNIRDRNIWLRPRRIASGREEAPSFWCCRCLRTSLATGMTSRN